MQIEIRTDGAHISGYVNATEKKSRPVVTPHGRVIEEIEPRAFQNALDRAENVAMTKDHGDSVLAETRAGTLRLYEDNIGLYADAVVTDEQTIEEARAGKIRGWSFGMRNVKDTVEARTDGELPLRKITGFDIDHITLVVKKTPIYSATSVEVRAQEETIVETRASEQETHVVDSEPKPAFDYSSYRARVDAIKK